MDSLGNLWVVDTMGDCYYYDGEDWYFDREFYNTNGEVITSNANSED